MTPIGLLTSVATATTHGLLGHAGGPSGPAALQAALTSGYAAALRGAGLLALAGATLAILILPPRRRVPIQPPTHPPTHQPKERS